jgi:phage portal protein BeeE
LPEEAWRIIAGEGGNEGSTKLYGLVPALYRGVDLRAGSVAAMPWEIVRGETVVMTNEDDAPEQFPWLDDLPELLYKTEAALTLTGRAYWFRERNLLRTLGVRWLRPDSVRPVIDTADGLTGFTRRVDSRDKAFEIDDFVYFWLPDPMVELGPAENYPGRSAMAAAGVLASMDAFMTSYFDRGMVKATLLKYTNTPGTMPMSEDERKRVKEWWRRVATGVKNAFSTEVVRGDFDALTIGEGLKDLQNTQLTSDQLSAVAMALGVPQTKLIANAANYATANSDALGFVQDTIIPQCRLIAQVINSQLLADMGLRLRFKPDELSLMQEDETQRAQSLKTLVDAGMSLEMAIAILGYDLPEGIELREGVASVPPTAQDAPDTPEVSPGAVTEQQVLNGAQIQSALSIIDIYGQGKLPRDNAVFMVQTFFNITKDIAEKLVPMDGEIPPAPAPATAPFTGQAPPPAPDEDEERTEETRRFQRWARKRANPDPEQFESMVLSHADKVALLEAAVADDAPFQGDWQGYP